MLELAPFRARIQAEEALKKLAGELSLNYDVATEGYKYSNEDGEKRLVVDRAEDDWWSIFGCTVAEAKKRIEDNRTQKSK